MQSKFQAVVVIDDPHRLDHKIFGTAHSTASDCLGAVVFRVCLGETADCFVLRTAS